MMEVQKKSRQRAFMQKKKKQTMANNKCFGGCLWPFEVLFNLVPLSSHLLRPYTFLVMKHDASDILRNTGLPVSCSGRIRALYLPQ